MVDLLYLSQYDGNSISFCPSSAGPSDPPSDQPGTWSYFPWQYISRFFFGSKNKRQGRAHCSGGLGVSVLPPPPPSSSTSDRSALIPSAHLSLSSLRFICLSPPQAGLSIYYLSMDRPLYCCVLYVRAASSYVFCHSSHSSSSSPTTSPSIQPTIRQSVSLYELFHAERGPHTPTHSFLTFT